MSGKVISIRGAREHNLQNVNVDLPRDKLVVLTGLSGSGKSSLAFDTIYAEGQRRYVESLSAYARQFLELMSKPDVDTIEGLSPAISIEQKTTSRNPRSTVGTVTEIYDYLRLLYARIGRPYSPVTGDPIDAQTPTQMVDRITSLPMGSRLIILAPIVRGRKGEYRKEIADLRAKGYQRLKIDGTLYEIDEAPKLDKMKKHDIDVVVDRIVLKEDLGNRVADSVETALKLGEGLIYVEDADNAERITLSSRFACPVSGFTIEEIEPRLFSFNSPHGACPTCDGLGVKQVFDPDLVVPVETLSLSEGAIVPWTNNKTFHAQQIIENLCHQFKTTMHTPWAELPEALRNILLHGSGTKDVTLKFADGARSYETRRPFEGVIPNLERRWQETTSSAVKDDLSRFLADRPCESCQGARLKPEALAVKVNNFNIAQTSALSIQQAGEWFTNLPKKLTKKEKDIAARILKEINERLGFLNNVGLSYLSLDRASATLSGGESQRIRLASQIGSGLSGVLYVLDEPSIGLHQRDNDRLLETLKRLRDLGNTVIVVEHDEDAIRTADYVVDMGPGAGVHGGKVVAEGTPQEIMDNPASMTGQYLSGKRQIAIPTERRAGNNRKLIIKKARGNNLHEVTAEIPLATFTCVTGVSGGGKSTLVIDTLYKSLARRLNGAREHAAPHEGILGVEHLDKVIDIDQSPIGRTPRSNPATYTGAFTPIRDWYCALPEAKARGYGPGRFSFNVKGGRCEACQGDGVIKIEMHFLPDVFVTCEECHGKRYNRETLEITYRDKSIADVLEMTVEEAAEFFKAQPMIYEKMETLRRVGLGYIHVGQSATTLSGGEAQRIKLAKELSRRATGRTLYILDEPTTGLHFEDVRKLLEVLQELVEQGNTVVVIEHNLEVIKTADWLIDIGPEGGNGGGKIVGMGTPEHIATLTQSHTGRYLQPYLKSQTAVSEKSAQPAKVKKKA